MACLFALGICRMFACARVQRCKYKLNRDSNSADLLTLSSHTLPLVRACSHTHIHTCTVMTSGPVFSFQSTAC